MAAPTMTSMVVTQPASAYAQAPAMTSMYATPGASMYMPATTVAANTVPGTTVAAPAVTTQAASYVAAPVAAPVVETVAAAPQPQVVLPQFATPQPAKLTAGMVTPQALESEKVAYGKALDAQLKKQCDAVREEASIKKKMVEQQAKTQLAQYQLQIEEQLKMAHLRVDQEAQSMIAGLEEAAITQQTARDEQTAIQTADYVKRKAIEDYAMQAYNVQKEWYQKELDMTKQYQAVVNRQASVVTGGQVI